MSKVIGLADVPLSEEDKDYLEVEKYIKGLVSFSEICQTPMSIALQGDWGTGKTSFINKMQHSLKDKKNITTVYFNTWQYSQLGTGNGLFTSLILNLTNSLTNENKSQEIAKKILKGVFTIVTDGAKKKIESTTGIDVNVIENVIKHETDKSGEIAKLKDNFSDLIKSTAGNDGRVILFIDDLDRLNPEVAVELLESLKLFMDVPNCVFVLAIDYDVVVKGIRKKYGSDMSEDKCRSFFDKIIQLPFRMPVESYDMKNLIIENIGKDVINGYEDIVADVLMNTLGPNPRTFKRLYNSYELLVLVGGRDDIPNYESAMLLLGLILQLHDQKEYEKLVKAVNDEDSFATYLSDSKDNPIIDGFFRISNADSFKASGKRLENVLRDVIQLSAITSVVSVEKKKKDAKKVTSIEVFGKAINVNNATDAVVKTMESIFENNPENIEAVITRFDNIFTTDKNVDKSVFRAKKELSINGYNQPVFLGTSTGYDTKVDQVKKLCKFLNVSGGSVIWYDENEKTVLV